ncbi:MAG: cobalamin B12-binding domain-containing protein [Candidatus Omnitrophica bacterium]|nr:cobalamin B12-binding domain-containing protein [Candidatus Omnitrophota bacterium]
MSLRLSYSKKRRIPPRILVAKLGLDGHDRGIKIIAHALRDAGYEVIYTGLFQTPEVVAQAAVEEDVRIVAVSILSGAHKVLLPKVVKLLKKKGARDVQVIGGGIISAKDAERLKKQGIARVFGPGTPVQEIISFLDRELERS